MIICHAKYFICHPELKIVIGWYFCHPGGGELIHENLFLMNQEPKEAKPILVSGSTL
ncbi:MAG: hypothetical protein LBM09_00620 [Candidatus Nomurabacteria bacterium]|nr:hypothetical protein [Candidatus Nomurabacteria bacterium]